MSGVRVESIGFRILGVDCLTGDVADIGVAGLEGDGDGDATVWAIVTAGCEIWNDGGDKF